MLRRHTLWTTTEDRRALDGSRHRLDDGGQ